MRDDMGDFDIPELREENQKGVNLGSNDAEEIFGNLSDSANEWGQEALKKGYVRVQGSLDNTSVVLTESGIRYLHTQTREFGNFSDPTHLDEFDYDVQTALHNKYVKIIIGLDGAKVAVVTTRGIEELRRKESVRKIATKDKKPGIGQQLFQEQRAVEKAKKEMLDKQPKKRKRITREDLEGTVALRERIQGPLRRDIQKFEDAGHSFVLEVRPNPEDVDAFLLTVTLDQKSYVYKLKSDKNFGQRIFSVIGIVQRLLETSIHPTSDNIDE